MRRFLVLVFALLVGLGGQAAERYALVIGNSAYSAIPGLPNARSDADVVASFLRSQDYVVHHQQRCSVQLQPKCHPEDPDWVQTFRLGLDQQRMGSSLLNKVATRVGGTTKMLFGKQHR